MHTGGHEVIACAFRRALGQHGRFNVYETLCIQVVANSHGHFVAQHQVLLHLRTAQIQNPVSQACGFRQVFIIQLERGCDRGIQNFKPLAQYFHSTAFQVAVFSTRWAGTHQAFHTHTKFIAQGFGGSEYIGQVGVAHHLHQTFSVAKVDKNNTTVVTATLHPAAQGNGLAQVGL